MNLQFDYFDDIKHSHDYIRDKMLEIKDVLIGWIAERDSYNKSFSFQGIMERNISTAYELILKMTDCQKAYCDVVIPIYRTIGADSKNIAEYYQGFVSYICDRISQSGKTQEIQNEIEYNNYTVHLTDLTNMWRLTSINIYVTVFFVSVCLSASSIISDDRSFSDVLKYLAGFLADRIPVLGDIKAIAEFINLLDKKLQREKKISHTDDVLGKLDEIYENLIFCININSSLAERFRQIAITEQDSYSSI
jgi:hypothetical protein